MKKSSKTTFSFKNISFNKSSFVIFFSFSAISLITLIVLGLISHQINITQTQIDEIVSVNNKKLHLIFNMQQIARERSLALYNMVNTRDVFEYEETYSQYLGFAETFIKTRNKFLSIILSKANTTGRPALNNVKNSWLNE